MNTILKGLVHLGTQSHDTSKKFGYWDKERNHGEVIALIHKQVSEALQAIYKGPTRSPKIPQFTALEESLADVIIRVMDFSNGAGLNVSAATVAKLKYNEKLAKLNASKL